MPPAHKTPAPPPDPGPPPFYEATEDLYVGHPESGTMPARAFTAGSRVPPDLVAANGWEHQVKVPDMFAPPQEDTSAPEDKTVPAPPGHTAKGGEES